MDAGMLTVMKPVVVAVVLMSLLGTPLARLVYWHGSAEAAPLAQIPSGQLTRKTISGTVDSVSGSLIVVQTKSGRVEVNVTAETVVNVPPEKNVGVGVIEPGMKIVAFTKRPPKVIPVDATYGAARDHNATHGAARDHNATYGAARDHDTADCAARGAVRWSAV
jgi:hypothetical protein